MTVSKDLYLAILSLDACNRRHRSCLAEIDAGGADVPSASDPLPALRSFRHKTSATWRPA